MSLVYFTSFSTPDFKPYLDDLVKSAQNFGLNKFIIHGIDDLIRTSFYRNHYATFQIKTGFGYWLWKPFFVDKALRKINYGDVLFYVDAASLFIADPSPLIEIAMTNNSGIVAFDAWPMTNGQWTKRQTFINMNCDNENFWNAKHVIATLFLIRKTDSTVNFISEWLKECENIHSLSDNQNLQNQKNLPDFVEHRMDQSIFSILVKKHGFETYRNPSKWGNFLKTMNVRVQGEHISSPYALGPQINEYSENGYSNSPYGTILEFNRKANHVPKLSFWQKVIRHIKIRVIDIHKKVSRHIFR